MLKPNTDYSFTPKFLFAESFKKKDYYTTNDRGEVFDDYGWLRDEDNIKGWYHIVEAWYQLKERQNPMKVPYTTTGNSIVLILKGKVFTVAKSDLAYRKVEEYLKTKTNHDEDELERLLDHDKSISELTKGNVRIKDGTVYYMGVEVHNSLTDKLIGVMSEGYDPTPWVNFLDNLMANPSFNSRENLYNLLEKFNTPLTDDGCFVAFKRVRYDYRDLYSGKFDNSPGKVVKMDRKDVDDNSNHTCSRGLHACASEYLGHFYAGDSTSKVVLVKINPANVVSVPSDYNHAKMRVCEYEVLSEVKREDIKKIDNSFVFKGLDWGDYYNWD